MAGLFDRPPPPKGLFSGIFAGMGRGLTNPGGFFVNEGAPAAEALGSMVLSPFVQANQAMPWGGNDPRAIGIDPQTGSIDPSVMVPWATDVAGTVTAGAGLAPPVMGGAGMGIRAYHGSTHDFDRFEISPRTSHTGEGAQTYGPGGYFAEHEPVAQLYKEMISASHARRGAVGSYLTKYNGDVDRAITAVEDELAGYKKLPSDHPIYKEAVPPREQDLAELRAYKENPGRVYEVDIDASPDEFLDWDKPLSEQPGAVQDFVANHKQANRLQGTAIVKGQMAEPTGEDIMRRFIGDKNELTQELNAAGIKGIRYKDAGSRYHPADLPNNPIANEARKWLDEAQGDPTDALKRFNASNPVERFATTERDEVRKVIEAAGRKITSNYVVFDDKTISILKKYGLAGLTAGGAGAAMLGGGTGQAQAAQPPWMTGGRF